MRTFILLLLISLLSACDVYDEEGFCQNPSFEIAGLKVCTEHSVDSKEIEIVARIVEQKVREIYPQVSPSTFDDYQRNDIRIQFIDGALLLGCKEIESGIYVCEKNIGGLTQGSFDIYKIYIRHHDCLAGTSLVHELLHVIEYFYLDGPQGEDQHSRPYLFHQDAKEQGISVEDTVEQKIYNAVEPLLQSCR